MLEPLDPANRLPAASGDEGCQTSGPLAGAPRPAVAEVEQAIADHHACDGPDRSAPGGGGKAVASSWSSDWLQLSHDLRTPLNAILGNIELLLDGSAGSLAAPARACIGDIQVASRQLLSQLQPLLLLVQARTSGAITTRLPLDLLALIRQAAADSAAHSAADPAAGSASDRRGRGPHGWGTPCLPEDVRLMVPGDPIWLGALAAALVDLHSAAPGAKGPLSVDLEPPNHGAGVMVRVSWIGLDPVATSPLPLALIDAVLALHGGRICELSVGGLRLELPVAVLAPCRTEHGDR